MAVLEKKVALETPLAVAIGGLLLAIGILALTVLPGIGWGLPSEERNRLTLGEDRAAWRAPEIPEEEREDPWSAYPNFLQGGPPRTGSQPRSAFNPIRSFHPDEYVILKSLSAMRPADLKLFHGFFGWPALQFYIVGAALKLSSWLGLARLVPDMNYYFQNPAEMARLYEIGRAVTFVFSVGCLIVVWLAGMELFGRDGAAPAALLLAVTPMFTVNARYMTADVPMLFWICLTLLFAARILKGGSGLWYLAAGVTTGLAAATRYHGALAAFLVVAAHWMRPETEERPLKRVADLLGSKELWIAAAASIAVFLVCNPYILLRADQFAREFSAELRGSHCHLTEFPLLALLIAETGFGIIYSGTILMILLLVTVRRERAALFVTCGLGIPALILLASRPLMARYLMPAVALPTMLTAWAYAITHRRGKEIAKPAAKAAAPTLLTLLLVATFCQSLSFGRLFASPEADTRMRAGEWIKDNVPPGSSIGVASEPWQFELPPLNKRVHRVVILRPHISNDGIQPERPDYIVTSDVQTHVAELAGGGLPADQEAFWRMAREGSEEHGYAVVERFETWPTGQREFLRRGPPDMRYANPLITVVKRTR